MVRSRTPVAPRGPAIPPPDRDNRDKAAARAPTHFLTLHHSPFPLFPTLRPLGSIHRRIVP